MTLKGGLNMPNSNKRKLALCGWLQKHQREVYESSLKLQKFLFFYEVFSKTEGENADFRNLQGYERGPVFSTVYGDYKHEKSELDAVSMSIPQDELVKINQERAQKTSFMVKSLTENELTDLTHMFHVWSAKEARIMSGERNVPLSETDFNENDQELISQINAIYTNELVQNSTIVSVGEKNFVFSTDDYDKLTEQHHEVLRGLSTSQEIRNPVYVEIDKRGRLIVD